MKRGSIRYGLVAPVAFSWKTSGRTRVAAYGTTRDISVNGMFIGSGQCPPVSTIVRCEVLLPDLPGSIEPVQRLRLAAVGRVVRTEGKEGGRGFALRARATTLKAAS